MTSSRSSERFIGKLNDSDIRNVLRSQLNSASKVGMFVVEELGLCEGEVFVDLAVIEHQLEGFEIKSDLDSLKRLERQSSAYSRVLSKASLVVTRKHLEAARDAVPDWWGVFLAVPSGESAKLKLVRRPRRNPSVDAQALAQLLWRDEALAQLELLGKARGLFSKPRRALWERLVRELSIQQLQKIVCEQLKRREGWRSAPTQVQCDDSCLLEPRSLGSQVRPASLRNQQCSHRPS